MSLSETQPLNRRALLRGAAALGAALPLLAACGFTPVYGPQGGAGALQGRVALDIPEDRDAYLLAQRLEERLGRASGAGAGATYRLATSVRVRSEGLAITPDNDTTRYNLIGEADFVLSPEGSEIALLQGQAGAFTGYSATGSTVATLAAERDARSRLMVILADQIVARLIAASPGLPS